MPIYATRCTKCGHESDVILRVNEELPLCKQNECGGKLEKVPSAPNAHFKGGGWTPKFY